MYLVYVAIDRILLPNIVSGSAIIEVPKITGMSYNSAQKVIKGKGLDIEVAKEVYNESLPVGSVVTQVPVAESVVKAGRCIFVTVSKGKELVQVPYITGLMPRAAKINLMKAGFEIGEVVYVFNDNIGKDIIISQSHKAGAKIPYGEKINLIISKGPEKQIKVPLLIGLSLVEATILLSESGLSVKNITYVPDGTYLSDIVIGQSPNPGEIVTPETLINITVVR